MKELIEQLLEEWIGQKVIGKNEIDNLELAALEYLYVSREKIEDTNIVKEIEEKYFNGITGKQAIIASNVLADLIRKGIAKDPNGDNQ